MPAKFNSAQIQHALGELPGWSEDNDTIRKQFTFDTHITAMGFVVRLAMAAEVMDHHPDLRIVYNRVDLVLSSHDAGGVTERDIKLAKKAEELAA